jgi:hypothetical protein
MRRPVIENMRFPQRDEARITIEEIDMSRWWVVLAAGLFSLASAQAPNYKADITTGQTTMSADQQAKYKADYQAAKAQWAKMTPQEKSAAIAAARDKKLKDLSMIELVGQRDDMAKETASQSAALKSQRAAAKAQWDKMTPEQKQATRKSAWEKKRAELNAIERSGQRDDTYVLPW